MGTGTWGLHPFGLEATGWRTFGGVTIPHEGRVGWYFGTPRWSEGEFFRFRIERYELLGTSVANRGLPPAPPEAERPCAEQPGSETLNRR